MSNKITMTPITHSFFYQQTAYKKDQTNECAKLFLDHVKKTIKIPPPDLMKEIGILTLTRISDEKTKKELVQAINLELTIEGVQDLFKNLLNSKQISREELEEILDKINNRF